MNRQWKLTLLVLSLSWLTVIGIFHETAVSMMSVWNRSTTFSHGYLVLPCSIYLAWSARRKAMSHIPNPNLWGLPALTVFGFGWLLGNFSNTELVKHFSLILILQTLVWMLLGSPVALELLFPIAFLFLAVPVGESLIGPLQDSTALLAVSALQISGVPVLWEGRFITTPHGFWEIAEACSAISYVIPTLAITSMFSYIVYQGWGRRLVFVLAGVAGAIVANGLRVYTIIGLDQLSAQNGDFAGSLSDTIHKNWNWSFFVLALTVQFWGGLKWRERTTNALPEFAGSETNVPLKKLALTAIAAVMLVSGWPLIASGFEEPTLASTSPRTVTLSIDPPWKQVVQDDADWHADFEGVDAGVSQTYGADDLRIHLSVFYYDAPRIGADVVSRSRLVLDDMGWLRQSEGRTHIRIDGQSVQVRETVARSKNGRRSWLMWDWYWVGGKFTSNPYYAKYLQAWVRLLGGTRAEASITVATDLEDTNDAAQVLQSFLNSAALDRNLRQMSRH